MQKGTVRSVNLSKRKGGRKTPVEGGARVIEQFGFEGDGHADTWHRQVSFLAWESVQKARAAGLDVNEGDFAENITTEGIDLLQLPLGTQVKVGDEVVLEVSQIGKVCHAKCAIYYLAGDCIFPREGVFFVALHGGEVKAGDSIEVTKMGDGTCEFTPKEALEEIERERAREAAMCSSGPEACPAGDIAACNACETQACMVAKANGAVG